MKISTYLYPIAFVLFCLPVFGQVQVDHSVQLTGSGTDAKVVGIKDVTNSQDAMSVESYQKGGFIFGVATSVNGAYSLTLNPPVSAYYKGMVVNFMADSASNGPSTISINGLAAQSIKKNVTVDLGGCDIIANQTVVVIYDGTNFQYINPSAVSPGTIANAGPNQSIASTSVTLAANTPTIGAGSWSVVSGTGGSFTAVNSPTSTFTGTPGVTYTLRWTISNACSSNYSDVQIQLINAKYVFVTSSTNNGNFGGLAGADAICNARASEGGMPGTYVAWLSTSTVDAKSRLASGVPFIRRDGVTVANDLASLLSTGVMNNIILDESGNTFPNNGSSFVWTGTDAAGNKTAETCADWTDGPSGTHAAYYGKPYVFWTYQPGFDANCINAWSLYCFQQ